MIRREKIRDIGRFVMRITKRGVLAPRLTKRKTTSWPGKLVHGVVRSNPTSSVSAATEEVGTLRFAHPTNLRETTNRHRHMNRNDTPAPAHGHRHASSSPVRRTPTPA